MIEPKKLKVTELRDELKTRGLDTKGNKGTLVKRLEKALKAETGEPANDSFSESQDSSQLETTATSELDESINEAKENSQITAEESVQETEVKVQTKSTAEVKLVPDNDDNVPVHAEEVLEDVVSLENDIQQMSEPEVEGEFQEVSPDNADHREVSQVMETSEEPAQELYPEDTSEEIVAVKEKHETSPKDFKAEPQSIKEEPQAVTDEPQGVKEEPQAVKEEPQAIQDEPQVHESKPIENDKANEEPMEVSAEATASIMKDVKAECQEEEPSSEMKPDLNEDGVSQLTEEAAPDSMNGYQVVDSIGETGDSQERDDAFAERKRKRSRSRSHERQRSKRSRSPRRRRSRSHDRNRRSGSKDRPRYSSDRPHYSTRERSRSRDRAHRRDRSRDRRTPREKSRSPGSTFQKSTNEDDWITASNVQWDKYNCDLNIRVSDDGFKCNPITVEGFAYMWAGARSNYGFNTGKLAFECKVLETLNVHHLPEEETSRHVVRVGFSTDSTSMQLGEEKLSYGYGGTAKASTDCKFKDYGEKFSEGDVITAYLNFEGEKVEISFSKNEKDLGVCYEIEKEELGSQALFPHILTKNCEVTANFGQRETPYSPLKEGYKFVSEVPETERVRGKLPPQKKEDCELIMMCGLPGAGKTTWVEKHVKENKEKHYQVLGTNNIIDKMKVMGLPRKRNYAGRWDSLIDKSTKCLNRLLEIACKKKRNYIVDQTNVYYSARRRKMRSFEGFQRRAVIIVPEDEEFKRRCEKREKDEGKDVPDTAVWEMKANFKLPEVGDFFDKVDFVELGKEAAQELVAKYNKDGEQNLPPDYWQNRFNRDHNRGGYGGGQGRYGDRRDYNDRDQGNYRNRGSGHYDNRDRDRGSGRGGWKSNQGSYRGYSNDRSHGSYGSHSHTSSYGQDYSNKSVQSYNSGGGYGSNHGGYDHSAGGGNQGSWGSQQGGWGNQGAWGTQQQSSWGGQAQTTWGNQTYNWATGQWSGYSQQQQPSAVATPAPAAQAGQQQQAWGQGYNYYQYPQQQGWANYNYSYQQPPQPEQK